MRVVIERYESNVLGLPEDGRFIPITNSEAGRLGCLRQWWFQYLEGLTRGMEGGALDRGNLWDLVMEDVYRWWKEKDQPYPEAGLDSCLWCRGAGWVGADVTGQTQCEVCQGTGDGALVRGMAAWHSALDEDDAPFGPDDIEQTEEHLRRAFMGYVHTYEAAPMQNFRIVGVKERLARVILNPATGKPYRPDTFLVETEHGWIRAGTAALAVAEAGGSSIRRVNWPMYQVGELDTVARDRSNGEAWTIDAKFTTMMDSYRTRLQVDPQLPGYSWLLEAHLEHFGCTGVAGMMYDLTNGRRHGTPTELKWKPPLIGEMKELAQARGVEVPKGIKGVDAWLELLGIEPGHGGFSTADTKLANVPSWRMREAVLSAGLNMNEYREAIDWCEMHVDDGLYTRIFQIYTPTDRERYAHEVFGKAQRLASLYRAGVRVEKPSDIDTAYPRTPTCALPGGRCAFMGPCMQDSPEAREKFKQRSLIVWKDGDEPAPKTPSFQENLGF